MKRRVNITIPEHYYDVVTAKNLNLSGLLTGLLGDHLAGNTITIQVEEKTKRLYDQVIANTGYDDSDVEHLLHQALERLIEDKIAQLEQLRSEVADIANLDEESAPKSASDSKRQKKTGR